MYHVFYIVSFFSISDIISTLVDNVQSFINIVVGFFDLIASAFESVYSYWSALQQLMNIFPGEVNAVVFAATVGFVGAFVMW